MRPAGPAWLTDALMLGVPALVAMYVHVAALAAFYSPDDLILLERVRGIAPYPDTLWRLISGRLFWVGFFPVFGPDPFACKARLSACHANGSGPNTGKNPTQNSRPEISRQSVSG